MIKEAYFAGGCFWCIASIYTSINGVIEVIDGYSGGEEINPTYEEVKAQKTNHRETIKIIFDDEKVSFKSLLNIYLANIDPYDDGGQFIDRGHSYTLAIYYLDESQKEISLNAIKNLEEKDNKKVCISIEPFKKFYKAEEYHQNYHLKNPEEFNQELISSGRKKLTIRNTTMEDLDEVMEIYASAREFMKNNGNYDQWHDDWPPRDIIIKDIEQKISFVVLDEDKIEAVFMLYFGVDPTYLDIRIGAWLSDKPYGTIHRLASKRRIKGIFKVIVDFALSFGYNLRADTHENNTPMRRALEKTNFIYCGIISPIEGGDRVAYELVINK